MTDLAWGCGRWEVNEEAAKDRRRADSVNLQGAGLVCAVLDALVIAGAAGSPIPRGTGPTSTGTACGRSSASTAAAGHPGVDRPGVVGAALPPAQGGRGPIHRGSELVVRR